MRDGDALENLEPGYSFELARDQLARLLAVKNWEVVHEFGLEDDAPRIYPEGKGEARAWPSNQRSVFNVAPHIVANNLNNLEGQDPLVGEYHSSVWYQLQMTLNANQKMPAGERPMDWPYQQRHVFDLTRRTNVPNAVRYAATQIKVGQERLNGRGPNRSGYELRSMHPWWNYSDPSGEVRTLDGLDGIEPGLRDEVVAQLITEFLDVVEHDPHVGFRPENWPRIGHDSPSTKRWPAVEPMDYVPVPYSGEGKLFEYPANYHADNFWRIIPLFREDGVDEAVLERLRIWCASMWPAGDWDALRAPNAPELRREVPASKIDEPGVAGPIEVLDDRDESTTWSAASFPRTLAMQSAWGLTIYEGIEIEGAGNAAYRYRVETGDGRVLADRTANGSGGKVLRASFDGTDAARRANRVKLILTGCEGEGCEAGPRLEEVRVYGREG